MTDVAFMTAGELLGRYRRRALSPVEVTRALLARLDAFDGELNAFCLRDDETALCMARESEARWLEGRPRGLLEGVPVTIKDLVLSRGWPTRRGSRTVDPDQAWDEDAPSVARLREHGAVFLGKTAVSEFGWKGTGDNPLTGITRNPWDTSLTPGGSSSGAAVAAAIGVGPLHIGSDGAGSIRIPCAFTGVFGLKPTYGRVPAYPPSAIGTLANVGPITRSAADAALLLTVIGEADHRFWLGLRDHGRDFRNGLERGIKGLRIAYWPRLRGVRIEPAIGAAVAKAVKLFEALGAIVEEEEPDFAPPLEAFRALFYGHIAVSQADKLSPAQRSLLDPGFRQVLEAHANHTTREWLAAEMERDRLGRRMEALFAEHDLLVMPQMPVPPLPAGVDVPPESGFSDWLEWSPFTYLFNMTTHPAATLPCGQAADGLPVALQLVGPRFRDDRVLSAASAFEAARPFHPPPLALRPAAA